MDCTQPVCRLGTHTNTYTHTHAGFMLHACHAHTMYYRCMYYPLHVHTHTHIRFPYLAPTCVARCARVCVYVYVCVSSGSSEACSQLAALQPVGAVNTPELQAMGMRIELDSLTGKFKMVRTSDAPQRPSSGPNA